MKRNPLIPFAMIAAIGILLMLVFSFVGLDNMEEMAKEEEGGGEEQAASNPEEIVKQNCTSCHGQNLEGGVGPSLKDVGERLDAAKIEEIINNGKGSMPGGVIPADQAAGVAEWLAGGAKSGEGGGKEEGKDEGKEEGKDEGKEEGGGDNAAAAEKILNQSCTSCHGQNLEGGVGPSLKDVGGRLKADEIQDIIVNGKGSMPGGLVPEKDAQTVADYLAEQK